MASLRGHSIGGVYILGSVISHRPPRYGEGVSRNYLGEFRFADAAVRAPYARKLREGLAAIG
jgi:hypothetical protein